MGLQDAWLHASCCLILRRPHQALAQEEQVVPDRKVLQAIDGHYSTCTRLTAIFCSMQECMVVCFTVADQNDFLLASSK